jgi:ABC-2 type transport system permease protein
MWLSPAVKALVRKELREYRHHRSILLTALGLPVVFLFLPVIYLGGFDPGAGVDDVRMAVGQAMFTFFLTPVIVPAAMAAYSVIGEKEHGTLEPVLTLPITDREFIHAKVVAILVPAATISILVFAGYYLLGLAFFGEPVREPALAPMWAFGVVLMAAPMALYSTLLGMNISARAKDLRVAEQLVGMIILPTLVPISLITFQALPLGFVTWGSFLLLMLALDAVLLRLAYRTFNRERVLALAA